MTQGALHIPTVDTDRLVLRGPERRDFDAYASMLGDPRTRYMGGPFDRASAWCEFSKLVAGWQFDGFGGWVIIDRQDKSLLGEVGVLQTGIYPEPELGWTLTEAAEGHGYAFEAAQAVLGWWWRSFETDTLVSYTDPENTRSRALAGRLGATLDPDAVLPTGETAEETLVYRHTRPVQPERTQ